MSDLTVIAVDAMPSQIAKARASAELVKMARPEMAELTNGVDNAQENFATHPRSVGQQEAADFAIAGTRKGKPRRRFRVD